jgi:hypothetical protein
VPSNFAISPLARENSGYSSKMIDRGSVAQQRQVRQSQRLAIPAIRFALIAAQRVDQQVADALVLMT